MSYRSALIALVACRWIRFSARQIYTKRTETFAKREKAFASTASVPHWTASALWSGERTAGPRNCSASRISIRRAALKATVDKTAMATILSALKSTNHLINYVLNHSILINVLFIYSPHITGATIGLALTPSHDRSLPSLSIIAITSTTAATLAETWCAEPSSASTDKTSLSAKPCPSSFGPCTWSAASSSSAKWPRDRSGLTSPTWDWSRTAPSAQTIKWVVGRPLLLSLWLLLTIPANWRSLYKNSHKSSEVLARRQYLNRSSLLISMWN